MTMWSLVKLQYMYVKCPRVAKSLRQKKAKEVTRMWAGAIRQMEKEEEGGRRRRHLESSVGSSPSPLPTLSFLSFARALSFSLCEKDKHQGRGGERERVGFVGKQVALLLHICFHSIWADGNSSLFSHLMMCVVWCGVAGLVWGGTIQFHGGNVVSSGKGGGERRSLMWRVIRFVPAFSSYEARDYQERKKEKPHTLYFPK